MRSLIHPCPARANPGIDFILLEFPKTTYFVRRHGFAGDPFVDRIPLYTEIGPDFFHGEPSVFHWYYPKSPYAGLLFPCWLFFSSCFIWMNRIESVGITAGRGKYQGHLWRGWGDGGFEGGSGAMTLVMHWRGLCRMSISKSRPVVISKTYAPHQPSQHLTSLLKRFACKKFKMPNLEK